MIISTYIKALALFFIGVSSIFKDKDYWGFLIFGALILFIIGDVIMFKELAVKTGVKK